MTIIDTADLTSNETPVTEYGTLTVVTGWKKNGAGTDATLDMMIRLDAMNAAGDVNYMVSDTAVWFMAVSKDETDASSEMQSFSTEI